MDFSLSDEQQMIVKTTREFVLNELYPHEKEVEESGVLRILAFVDPLKLGDALIAVLNVQVASPFHEAVAQALSAFDEISYVSSVLGPYDFSVQAMTSAVAELWELICDPHHLPRWWPRVERVEDVAGGAFTELMRTSKGKAVRADFLLVRADEQTHSLAWEQQVEGTPFARVLSASQTIVTLAVLRAAVSIIR